MELSRQEIKEFRKIAGKISWLANSTRPDISFIVLLMSKKNNTVNISNLRYIKRILKKVRERDSKIKFKRIGGKDDLMIVGIGDVSLKSEEKAVGGVFLFIMNLQVYTKK